MSTYRRVILAEIIDILLHWHRLGQLTPNFPCLKPYDKNRQYPVITQGHSKKLASTEKNKNMLKLINSACDICDNDIAHFSLPVTKIARKITLCAPLAGNYTFKPTRRVPWNLFLFVRMNTFVYYHSALLAHFPPDDTKIAEELRGAPRESPHNRDFEETVNLIVYIVTGQLSSFQV